LCCGTAPQREAERLGNAREPSAAHAISALLVFLHLLEGYSDLIGQIGLRHVPCEPLDADVLTDGRVG